MLILLLLSVKVINCLTPFELVVSLLAESVGLWYADLAVEIVMALLQITLPFGECLTKFCSILTTARKGIFLVY